MKIAQKVGKFCWNIVSPPSAYSWKSFIWLSLFSWLVSLVVTGWTNFLLHNLGWIFLTIGVTWGAGINNWWITPWLTSSLLCLFIFGDLLEDQTKLGLLVWCPLAAVIRSVILFIDDDQFRVPSVQDRQKIILLCASQLLLSCWLQFYFIVDHWLELYPSLPSLGADNFNQSSFIVAIGEKSQLPSRGILLLDTVGNRLEEQLEGQSWGTIERWLLAFEREERLAQLKKSAQEDLTSIPEDYLWALRSQAKSQPPGYLFQIQGSWKGPGEKLTTTSLVKFCDIIPVFRANNGNSETMAINQDFVAAVGQVECKPTQVN